MTLYLRSLFYTITAFFLLNLSISFSQEKLKNPLNNLNGNPLRGKTIVRDVNNVSCLICHEFPIPDEPNHGRIGPSLIGVGSRFTIEELRRKLIYPKALNPNSIMPSYFQIEKLHRVSNYLKGKPIYTAQQVEDVITYLFSLKEIEN